VKFIQTRILRSANTRDPGISAMIPLLLIGMCDSDRRHRQSNLSAGAPGTRCVRLARSLWNMAGITLFAAACSSPVVHLRIETAVCYTGNSRIRRPTRSRRSFTRACSASWSTPGAVRLSGTWVSATCASRGARCAGKVVTPASTRAAGAEIYSARRRSGDAKMVHAGQLIGAVVSSC